MKLKYYYTNIKSNNEVYILSLILAPTKFHLLRGNHEHRELQKNFTFYTECLQKFGTPELGEMVWEEINKAFDAMPIAAVVDKKVWINQI